jgi:cytochrome c biogenesis protein CcmG, thiol:disulfide interchange protein DsbE
MRRALIALAVVALGVVLFIGLRSAPKSDTELENAAPSAEEVSKAFAGSPAPLAKLHGQKDRIIGGSQKALDRTIRDLRGYPVVVNLWASWCTPCRSEFPIFQTTAVDYGKRVGFLGVLIQDKRPAAERFLREYPLTYPSIDDPRRDVFDDLRAAGVPTTAFFDRHGKLAFLHQGVYRSKDDLHQDIRQYLGVS